MSDACSWVFTDTKPLTKWKKLTTCWLWVHSTQTSWRLRLDHVNPWHCPVTSSSTNQRITHELIMHPETPSLTLLSKALPWKPVLGSLSFLSRSPLYSLLGACTKHCTFFYHNPMSVNCLCCQVSRPKFDLVSARCRMMHLRPYVSLHALSLFAWRWWDILWACGKW